MWARYRRWSMTLLIMAYRRNVPTRCAISLFAPTFTHSAGNGSAARVEHMTVRLQPGAWAVRAKPRASPPAKAAWLHEDMAN